MSTGITNDTAVLATAEAAAPEQPVYTPTFGEDTVVAEPAKVEAFVYARDHDEVPDFERQPKARVELLFPPLIGGVKTGHLDMRRPTLNDRLINGSLKGTDADRELALFANLTQQAIPDLLKLDLVDYGRLQDTFRSFLGFHRPEKSDLPS
jgi:hypothetical protein